MGGPKDTLRVAAAGFDARFYAAALPAAFRWNPSMRALYRRLIESGKPHAIALVACARKLLIFANTVVTRGTPWTERPAAA